MALPQASALYGARTQPRLSQPALSSSDLHALKEAAASGGRYQVRLQLPLTKDTRRQMDFITASVPACALLASNLADSLRLTLDQFGNVVGVDYRTATADCGSATEQPTSSKFDTKVSLNVGAEAPKPFRQELETPEAAKEKAEGEKGFIAKYWMYIVPFVLVLLFSGGMGGQESEAAQGGEGAAPAASAGRGAPARRGGRR